MVSDKICELIITKRGEKDANSPAIKNNFLFIVLPIEATIKQFMESKKAWATNTFTKLLPTSQIIN